MITMKRILTLAFVLSAFAGLLAGCDWFEEPNYKTEIPEGMLYTTQMNLTFFFEDAEGNDLVNLDDPETYPVVYPGKVAPSFLRDLTANPTTVVQGGIPYSLYAEGHNWLSNDLTLHRNGFGTHVWGRTVEPEFVSYVYVGGGMDSLTVAFKYVTSDDPGVHISGGGWAVEVESIKYNTVEVLNGNKEGKVFIRKPSPDESVVSVNVADCG